MSVYVSYLLLPFVLLLCEDSAGSGDDVLDEVLMCLCSS